MADTKTRSLDGLRILVVEDEYFLADDLAKALRAAGAEPVGPFGTLAEAEARLGEGAIDGAVVDMNLRGEMAFELAGRIAAAGLPCVIVSGYSENALPETLAGIERLEKPVSAGTVVARLAAQLEAKPTA